MSQENVEIVRRWWASLEAGELPFDLTDENVRIDNIEQPVIEGAYHGHDGLRRFFRDWHEAWTNIEYDFEELIDAGDEHVIAVVTRRARGRASGVEVERPFALVWMLREGKVVRVVWFLSRAEALEAVGLSEQDAHADS